MTEHVVRSTGQLHGRARLALRRPGLRPVFFRSDFGAGLPSPSEDGGLLEFFEVCFTRAVRSATWALQPGHPCLQLIDLRALCQQVRDVRIPLGQQLPQPRVGRAQSGGHLIRRGSLTGRIGHKPHTARADPP